MEHRTKEILELINDYFEKHPTQRFGQILFNLDINQFLSPDNPSLDNHRLRDIYSDIDSDIVKRIKLRINN